MPDASMQKIDVPKVSMTAVFGAGIAVVTFFLSDAALPEDTPWWVHWAMAAASIVSYAIGVVTAIGLMRGNAERAIKDVQRDADEFSSRLEDERQRHQADLERLEKSEKLNEELRNLLAAERTLSSSYREKYKDASARLEEREKSASKEERARMLEEDRNKTAYRQWILSLSPDEKLLLLQISRNGEKTIGPMSSSVFVDGISSSRYNFAKGVEYTRVSGHDDQYYWRLTFNEWGSAAVSENMGILLEAEKYADQEKNEASDAAGA